MAQKLGLVQAALSQLTNLLQQVAPRCSWHAATYLNSIGRGFQLLHTMSMNLLLRWQSANATQHEIILKLESASQFYHLSPLRVGHMQSTGMQHSPSPSPVSRLSKCRADLWCCRWPSDCTHNWSSSPGHADRNSIQGLQNPFYGNLPGEEEIARNGHVCMDPPSPTTCTKVCHESVLNIIFLISTDNFDIT